MSEYVKPFYLLRVKVGKETAKNPKMFYYGRNTREIPIGFKDNIPWYIKEYGFESPEEARKNAWRVAQKLRDQHCTFTGIEVAKTTLTFPSYEEYLRVRA